MASKPRFPVSVRKHGFTPYCTGNAFSPHLGMMYLHKESISRIQLGVSACYSSLNTNSSPTRRKCLAQCSGFGIIENGIITNEMVIGGSTAEKRPLGLVRDKNVGKATGLE
ncbi:unnamed protein product [Aspergillus oryzae var. brunneus]|uniref:Unnamed protein product n=1 Tax=Aspergillus oryzae var. brunneus TaxID=332754 RepID=A0ABQ6L6J0_ASPOZ|nr:unnamed protein product [Aspergillus oryzae]GMG53640.1 unnamed protein product [Aspergillus oryzae var. brunneus]